MKETRGSVGLGRATIVSPKRPTARSRDGLRPARQAGADETLLDDSRIFAERGKKAGVEVRLDVLRGMLHSFHMMAGRAPEADDAIGRFAEWVRAKLGLEIPRQKTVRL
jgi:acetyl esterase/lipase